MKVMSIAFCTALFLLFPSINSFAEEKIGVSVSHSGDDVVGQKLAFSLKEVIRGSNGYQLISGPAASMRVALVTLEPENSNSRKGTWTVASVVITMRNFNQYVKTEPHSWYPIFLTSLVMTSGSNRVEDTAKSILASVDAALEEYREDVRKSSLD